MFESTLFPLVLTCLLRPSLGTGDTYALRELAAEGLRYLLKHATDDVAHQRACNTLVATLTSPSSTLASVYGSICGLAVMGRDVFEPVFMPLLGTITSALENVVTVAHHAGPHESRGVEDDVVRLSCVIERALRDCGLYENDRDLVDVVL